MGLDHEKLKQRRAGARSGTGWRPRPGENHIRILPPHSKYLENWEELENFALAYKMHFFRVEGRPTEVTRCLEEQKQKCPACAVWRVNRKSEDPGLKEMAREISPADQYLLNILDISNIQSGLQRWSANWTCWDKIMEIGGNPQWGNVVDPSDGVNFTINMTPGSSSRSGYNTYSVMPEPQRTTVMEILNQIPDWRAALDDLQTQMAEYKEPEEIKTLLIEAGFPPLGSTPQRVVAPATAAPQPTASTPAAVTPPPPTDGNPGAVVPPPAAVAATPAPVGAPAPVGGPLPVATTPTPVATAEVPAPVAAPTTPAPVATVHEIHYDPGPDYTPKVPDAERPPGVPRCFGDYSPKVHRCAPCPASTECQLLLLGLSE